MVEEEELLALSKCLPANSVSAVTVRAMFLMGVTQRSISSTATGAGRGPGEGARLVGVGEQLLHATGEHVAGGLVPADQDEEGLVEDGIVVETVAVDLGVVSNPIRSDSSPVRRRS